MGHSKISTYLRLVALALSASHLVGAAECDRLSLEYATSRLVAAQSLGQVGYLTALLPNATYTENDKTTNISTGILSQALKIDHSRSIQDTTNCSTYTELVISDPEHPYVIGTQMRFTNGNITTVETRVTQANDWLFNATHTLYYVLRENWDPIPVEKRDNRSTIQAAADAYLDVFDNPNVTVPWGDPCSRLEGGLLTIPCSDGVPVGISLVDRRYVIDETVGSVDVFLSFGGGTNGSALPDSHEFRVEGGKIRHVHTITVCWTPNCDFAVPPQLSEDLGY